MTRRMLGMGAAAALALALATTPAAAQTPQDDAVSLSAPTAAQAPDVQTRPANGPEVQPAPAQSEGNDPAQLLRPSAAGANLLAPAAATSERELVHQPAYSRRTGVPLMIVGGAMFLAGAIIDDRAGDAIMVAGVVVAAIGLYQYLQ